MFRSGLFAMRLFMRLYFNHQDDGNPTAGQTGPLGRFRGRSLRR